MAGTAPEETLSKHSTDSQAKYMLSMRDTLLDIEDLVRLTAKQVSQLSCKVEDQERAIETLAHEGRVTRQQGDELRVQVAKLTEIFLQTLQDDNVVAAIKKRGRRPVALSGGYSTSTDSTPSFSGVDLTGESLDSTCETDESLHSGLNTRKSGSALRPKDPTADYGVDQPEGTGKRKTDNCTSDVDAPVWMAPVPTARAAKVSQESAVVAPQAQPMALQAKQLRQQQQQQQVRRGSTTLPPQGRTMTPQPLLQQQIDHANDAPYGRSMALLTQQQHQYEQLPTQTSPRTRLGFGKPIRLSRKSPSALTEFEAVFSQLASRYCESAAQRAET